MAPQARYWILTIPHNHFTPYLPNGVQYIRGQLERGAGGYLHWQLIVYFAKKIRATSVSAIFGPESHNEPSRSIAVEQYVWKDESAVPNTRFELGNASHKRDRATDWDGIWEAAKRGDLESIPSDIRIRNYNAIKRIAKACSITFIYLSYLTI